MSVVGAVLYILSHTERLKKEEDDVVVVEEEEDACNDDGDTNAAWRYNCFCLRVPRIHRTQQREADTEVSARAVPP